MTLWTLYRERIPCPPSYPIYPLLMEPNHSSTPFLLSPYALQPTFNPLTILRPLSLSFVPHLTNPAFRPSTAHQADLFLNPRQPAQPRAPSRPTQPIIGSHPRPTDDCRNPRPSPQRDEKGL
jgi:hypothetical protein